MKKLIVASIFGLVSVNAMAYSSLVYPTAFNKNALNSYNNSSLQFDLNMTVADSVASNATNTKSTTLNGLLDYKTYSRNWAYQYSLEALKSSNTTKTSNVERYVAGAKASKMLAPSSGMWYGGNSYVYGKIQAEYDDATVYDYSIAPTVGYGRQILSDAFQTLDVEVGAGGQYLHSDKETDFQVLLTAGANYQRQLNNNVSFEQALSLEFGTDTRVIRSHSAILAKLTDNINGQVSYKIKSTDTDSVDTRDNLLSVGLRFQN